MMFAPGVALTVGATQTEQDFIITAYYSPLPDQCCYVRGSEEADKILNGQGSSGADGTPVYAGMAAAPASYGFGTRIALPGIGVVTVHDRGGAIEEQADGHRLDLWVGYGEEGLARALAFGVQRVRGTVHSPGSEQPRERIVLDRLESPFERLRPFLVLDHGLLDARPRAGQIGLSVAMLQEHLRDLGYFSHGVTGKFGSVTQEALSNFLRDMGIAGLGDALTERAAASLVAALHRKDQDVPVAMIDPTSSTDDIAGAQRLLRFLGLYRGRTDGRYTDTFHDAIVAFQKSQGLVASRESPGAGRIGPLTRGRLEIAWRRTVVAKSAQRLLLLRRTVALLEERRRLVEGFLWVGHAGPDVRVYQELLAERGFFPKDRINGVFGPLTHEATIHYQLAMGLIEDTADTGAGIVGPQTLRQLRREEVEEAYRMVRSYGLSVL